MTTKGKKVYCDKIGREADICINVRMCKSVVGPSFSLGPNTCLDYEECGIKECKIIRREIEDEIKNQKEIYKAEIKQSKNTESKI